MIIRRRIGNGRVRICVYKVNNKKIIKAAATIRVIKRTFHCSFVILSGWEQKMREKKSGKCEYDVIFTVCVYVIEKYKYL